jgi:DNA relaxase NicK
MKFDWYQASIPEAHHSTVMEAISGLNYYGDWEQTRPLKGYTESAQFVLGGQSLCRINFGGQNEQYGPNILASGSGAPKIAEVVRKNFPNHRVSRVDSCEDYYHKDIYEYLRKKALKIAKEQGVYVREIVKPLDDCDDGRTLYLGSDSSAVRLRLYEKGKQLGQRQDWVRAEVQLRPQKDVKAIAAALSPQQIWGMSKWSHALAVQMGHEELKRVDVQIYQPSDHQRAYAFMLKQYRKVFEQMRVTHGSPETVGAQIFLDLDEIEQQRKKTLTAPSSGSIN